MRFDEPGIIGTYDGKTRDTEDSILKSCLPEEIQHEEFLIDEVSDPLPNNNHSLPDEHNTGSGESDEERVSIVMDWSAIVEGERLGIPEKETINQNDMVQEENTKTNNSRREKVVELTAKEARDHGRIHTPSTVLRRSARNIAQRPLGLISKMSEGATSSTNIMDEGEPTSYREALSQNVSEMWKAAMRDEFASLVTNKTWSYARVNEVPKDMKIIGCRWVFRKKINPDHSTRYKARLVIKGYEQVPGIDFGDTYAPVARLVSLRLVLAFAASEQWEIHHMDVVTAFLNPPIDSTVYMELPEGISWLDSSVAKLKSPCCHLEKALYGLKQAPRLWYKHIDSFLKSINFCQSANDPNLYTHTPTPGTQPDALILLYVDDWLIPALSAGKITEIKKLLSQKYRMNNLGPIRQFLGLEILRPSATTILLHQSRFISLILKRFGMTVCN